MKRLGISIYSQHGTLNDIKEYMELAYANGFDRIFTCLMSLKNDEQREKLQQLNQFAVPSPWSILLSHQLNSLIDGKS